MSDQITMFPGTVDGVERTREGRREAFSERYAVVRFQASVSATAERGLDHVELLGPAISGGDS